MQLAMEYGDRVRFLKIDTDEEHELADQMKVWSCLNPTFVFSLDVVAVLRSLFGSIVADTCCLDYAVLIKIVWLESFADSRSAYNGFREPRHREACNSYRRVVIF